MEELKLAIITGVAFAGGYALGNHLFRPQDPLPIKRLVELVREIREVYQNSFSKKLAQLRAERRKLSRTSEDYENYVYEVMEVSHTDITKAQEAVLERHSLAKSDFERRISENSTSPELAKLLNNFSKIEVHSEPSKEIRASDLEKVLVKYHNIIETSEPDSIFLNLTIFLDEVYDEYGYEAEHIELAAARHREELAGLYKKISEANQKMGDFVV